MASPQAQPSDAAIKARIISHMNKDHGAEMELYLRAFNGLPAAAAARPQLVDMSLDAMTIKSASGTHTVAIEPPLESLAGARVRLVDMSQTALRRLGLSDIKIDRFAPPAGFDCVVFFGVAFYFFSAATLGLVTPGTTVWTALDSWGFPYGAEGYRWIVKAIFWPVLLIHIAEMSWMMRTRLLKHRVPVGSMTWLLWCGTTFLEGIPAFRRFDGLVEREQKRKDAAKH